MSGLAGWWGTHVDDADAVVERMLARLHWGGTPERGVIAGRDFALAALGAP